MEKRDVFAAIDEIEGQMGNVHAELGSLKKQVIHLLEENKRLSLENQHLRKLLRLEELPEGAPSEQRAQDQRPAVPELVVEDAVVGEGYDNLARIYNEGFHICNVYYGHLRTEGDCLFCLSFLNK
ncbi:hypothetical protein SY83_06600 [Paenibacillus swuensis]|uniref:Replication initiation control protein YabA n=1 Tax=Paenibacillus swuensis TaxID=1178515 RepID=A0A172TG28_9BACL|nr:DNA replication initiation control protein YabA [Paenibacillus swuensis]ANE46009.1 hypothetical protein SY83_06600 [Paenibacillus swuensis]